MPWTWGCKASTAIVTGGSRDIGKAIARELAREGVDVAMVARNRLDLEATARALSAEMDRRILPVPWDHGQLYPSRHDQHTPSPLAARGKQLGVSPEEAERQDFAPDLPRGNAIRRMVDAREIAFVTAFVAADTVWRSPASWSWRRGEPGERFITRAHSLAARRTTMHIEEREQPCV